MVSVSLSCFVSKPLQFLFHISVVLSQMDKGDAALHTQDPLPPLMVSEATLWTGRHLGCTWCILPTYQTL